MMASAASYGVRRGESAAFAAFRVVERHVVAAVALCFLPFAWPMLWLGLLSYGVRLWGMEAVYHRYFSHRAYKTGRRMQFVLALIGAQTGQRGPLWWASKHRDHHKFVETERDPHSPAAHSFFSPPT